MHVYKELLCDDQCKKQRKRILRKIKYHAGLTKTYVVALSEGPDYFDIIPGYVFKQKCYPTNELHILALADGYDSAVALVMELIEKFHNQYETYQFKAGILKDKEINFTGYNRK